MNEAGCGRSDKIKKNTTGEMGKEGGGSGRVRFVNDSKGRVNKNHRFTVAFLNACATNNKQIFTFVHKCVLFE